jgi:ATP-dependent Lon protease
MTIVTRNSIYNKKRSLTELYEDSLHINSLSNTESSEESSDESNAESNTESSEESGNESCDESNKELSEISDEESNEESNKELSKESTEELRDESTEELNEESTEESSDYESIELESTTEHESNTEDYSSADSYDSISDIIENHFNNKNNEINSKNNEINKNNIVKTFEDNIYSIANGKFFHIYKNNYTVKKLKEDYSIDKLNEYNIKFEKLRNDYILKNIGIVEILDNPNLSIENKKKILEKIYLIANSEILSNDYNEYVKELKELVNNTDSNELIELENKITNTIDKDECGIVSQSYKQRILKSEMNFNNKVIAYKYMKIMENYGSNSSSEEHIKYKSWLNTLLTIPFNKYYNIDVDYNSLDNIKSYISKIRKSLDNNLSFLENPKDQIINIISQIIRNPQSNINAIGLYGNKGLGKTHFVECVANALNRPLVRISLGGNSDAHSIKGHNFTYIGSRQGKIIDAIIESKVMNPIIFFDEIDKISKTDHGRDITGSLIHLIDLTTNNKYNGDEYFSGIEIDLSRALFIFTYNNPNLIDPILADRIYKIEIKNYNIKEKIEIAKTHLIDSVLNSFNFTKEDILFETEAINYIVETSKNNHGMRTIKGKIQTIISRINTLLLTDKNEKVINLQYKKLYNYYSSLPVNIKKEHIDIILENSINEEDKEDNMHLMMYI